MTLRHERQGQKQRTRDAILDGARRLLARGEPVTVAAAAAEHGISRATAYRYFSDSQALTLEAGLDTRVPPYDQVVAGAADLRARLLAVVAAMVRLALEHEPAFRQYLAHAVAAPPERRSRGARRVAYLQRALAAGAEGLGPREQARLVAGLSAMTGIEALVALTDIAGLPRAQVPGLVAEMAGALIDRHLEPPG